MRNSGRLGRSKRGALRPHILVHGSLLTATLLSGCVSVPKMRWSDPPNVDAGVKPSASPKVDAGVKPSAEETRFTIPPEMTVPAVPPAASEYPIELTTALRLAEVENPLIAESRQRIGEALAVQQGAQALLLPSLNIGMNYHAHTGNLQRSAGRILSLNEKSLYFGGGAGAFAASQPEVPAVNIYSQLTDAYFEPLAARQQVDNARFSASATANTILMEVSELYFDLLAAEADLRVRLESTAQEAEIARLTRAYADAQQGRRADAERAAT